MRLLTSVIAVVLVAGCASNKDSQNPGGTNDAGTCEGREGCGDLCRSLEPTLAAIAEQGGEGWTAELDAQLDSTCAGVESLTDCEECITTIGEDIIAQFNVCGLCMSGLDSDSIRRCNQTEEKDWTDSDFEHARDSCYATCEDFGLSGFEPVKSEIDSCLDDDGDCTSLCRDEMGDRGMDPDSAESLCDAYTMGVDGCGTCWEALGEMGSGMRGPCDCGLDDSDISDCSGETNPEAIESIRSQCYAVCEQFDVWG